MSINDDILWKIDSEIGKDKKVVELRREIERLKIIEEKYKDSQLYIKDFKDEIERLNNIIKEFEKILNYDIDESEEYMNKIRRSSLQQGDYSVRYYRAEWQKEKAIGYLNKLQELKGSD